ncbi:hypothetical protein TRIUR3_18462 [Triticum urartu]|uniref:Uncharacterized protein n=1 Tax=Triticum urartu TaxID=4572 RepID=M7ZQ46_TRIUA|nr:hypothetical protein TRIUR3_18462 [Triticum urartu]
MEGVVLAEIKTAAAVSPGPLRIRRSGNGVARASSPSVALGRGQVDFLSRLGNSDRNDVQTSEHSDAEAKKNNYNKAESNGDGEVARSADKLGDAEITGDSDTEPSYVYVKREHEEVGEEEAAEVFQDTMASPPSSETMASSPSSETMAAASDATGTSVKESSGSLYSNVQSSFSHGSELDASAAGSSGGALSTEEVLEADAAMLRMKREEADEVEEAEHQSIVFLPSTCCASRSDAVPVAGMPQSPMDAVAGLKRFLTFGKKNGNGAEAAMSSLPTVIPGRFMHIVYLRRVRHFSDHQDAACACSSVIAELRAAVSCKVSAQGDGSACKIPKSTSIVLLVQKQRELMPGITGKAVARAFYSLRKEI